VRYFLSAIVLLFATPSSAYFVSGNALWDNCQGKDLFCMAFILGAHDTYKSFPKEKELFCTPPEVTGGQVHDIAKKYLEQHPEERHMPASFLVIRALQLAFPCPE